MHPAYLRTYLLIATLALAACTPAPNAHPNDPYEPMNRTVFAVNQTISKFIVRPIASTYADVVPNVVQHGVDNIFQNLDQPFYAINHSLQGHWKMAGLSLWRFLVNSTAGIVGLMDIASEAGLPPYPQNFAQTLTFYGCKNQTYFVLPLIGPKMTCEVLSLPVDYYAFDFWPYLHNHNVRLADGLWLTRFVDRQSRLMDLYSMMDTSFDPYIFMRHGYFSTHNATIIPPMRYDLDNDDDD